MLKVIELALMLSSRTSGAGVPSVEGCDFSASSISCRALSASVSSGIGSRMRTRPCALPWVTLRTFCVISCEFGTITVERSHNWISVARTLMRRMSPSTSLDRLTQSPTFTGRSTSRIRPEMKFCTTACRPKPMPTDSALAIHAMLCRLTFIAASASANTTTPPR